MRERRFYRVGDQAPGEEGCKEEEEVLYEGEKFFCGGGGWHGVEG